MARMIEGSTLLEPVIEFVSYVNAMPPSGMTQKELLLLLSREEDDEKAN